MLSSVVAITLHYLVSDLHVLSLFRVTGSTDSLPDSVCAFVDFQHIQKAVPFLVELVWVLYGATLATIDE